jgi:Lipopolysaccharide-assembly
VKSWAFTGALLLSALVSGCGYHLAGRGDLIPKNVRTIAVMPFGNATTRYKLARLLPQDLSRELISRTKYKLVTDPNAADAVLNGALTSFAAYPVIFDPFTNRATSVQAIVTVQVRLVNRSDGKVIFERPGAEFRQNYEISIDPAAYFDESGTAMERLSKDVARGLVSAILNAF